MTTKSFKVNSPSDIPPVDNSMLQVSGHYLALYTIRRNEQGAALISPRIKIDGVILIEAVKLWRGFKSGTLSPFN